MQAGSGAPRIVPAVVSGSVLGLVVPADHPPLRCTASNGRAPFPPCYRSDRLERRPLFFLLGRATRPRRLRVAPLVPIERSDFFAPRPAPTSTPAVPSPRALFVPPPTARTLTRRSLPSPSSDNFEPGPCRPSRAATSLPSRHSPSRTVPSARCSVPIPRGRPRPCRTRLLQLLLQLLMQLVMLSLLIPPLSMSSLRPMAPEGCRRLDDYEGGSTPAGISGGRSEDCRRRSRRARIGWRERRGRRRGGPRRHGALRDALHDASSTSAVRAAASISATPSFLSGFRDPSCHILLQDLRPPPGHH